MTSQNPIVKPIALNPKHLNGYTPSLRLPTRSGKAPAMMRTRPNWRITLAMTKDLI